MENYDHKKKLSAVAMASVAAASSSLPIYLIDTSTSLSLSSATNSSSSSRSNSNSSSSSSPIVVSTWGEIASQWNRTTEYDNLLSLASTRSSLPNSSYNNSNNKQQLIQKRPIILIHCGPKVGSTTLRVACRRNIAQTCPQLLELEQQSGKGHEKRAHAPTGYFGGERLHTVMRECTNTHYFCVNQITMSSEEEDDDEGLLETIMMRSGTEEEEEEGEVDDGYDIEERMESESNSKTITRTISSLPNANTTQYIHLFPFRNYNDWVKSATKQQYDRAGVKGCNSAQRHWEYGKCNHYQMEIDIRKYGRVDLDRFQDGIVKRQISRRISGGGGGTASRPGGDDNEEEEHTFILYLHRDLQKVIEIISSIYNIPMLAGTSSKKKGKRPEGTCNESLVEMYHDCFSDELMNFRWDLEENMLT